MTQPFFSIVVPVYNRAGKVGPCFQSVLAQTFQDWEVVVVDDGSADGEELERVVAGLGDARFRYIRRANGGGSAARNTGIDAARGRYIAFLDSDDQFLPDRLQKSVDVIAGAGEGDLVVYSQFRVERGVGKHWIRPARGHREGERIDEYLMCTDGAVRTSTITMTTGLAQRVRFDEALPSSQDTDFAVRCASAGARFVFIPIPLVLYDDVPDLTRVSKQKDVRPLLAWIERMRGTHISDKAYWGYRGWHCARLASRQNTFTGLGYYLPSALRGVYPPRHAARLAAQVLIPQATYQRIVNKVVATFGR